MAQVKKTEWFSSATGGSMNGKTVYSTAKVFDWLKMPKDVKDIFKAYADNYDYRNDSYVVWDINEEHDDESFALVDKWLLDNGAEEGDFVLILYWW